MALGLLAGALAGGGDAVQQNARSRIDELKQTRLAEMQQRYQTSERVAGQEFTAEQNQQSQQFTAEQGQIDRDYRAGESAADRAQRLQLAQMRESGANSRAAAGRNDWSVMQANDGSLVRINPRSGDIEPMDAGGLSFGGGEWGGRQKAYLDALGNEYKVLSKRVENMGLESLSEEEQKRYQSLPMVMQRHTLGIQSGDVDSEIDVALGDSGPPVGIRRPGLLSGGADGSSGGGGGSRGDDGAPDARAALEEKEAEREVERSTQQETQSVRRLSSTAKNVATDLQNFRDYSATSFGGDSDEWRSRQSSLFQRGREQMAELMSVYNGTQDEDLRDLLMEGMEELRKAGIPLPQE